MSDAPEVKEEPIEEAPKPHLHIVREGEAAPEADPGNDHGGNDTPQHEHQPDHRNSPGLPAERNAGERPGVRHPVPGVRLHGRGRIGA